MGPNSLAEPCSARFFRRSCCGQLVPKHYVAVCQRSTPGALRWRRRWALAASSDFQPNAPDTSKRTISSLDKLLGSDDSMDGSLDSVDLEEGRRQLGVSGETWERRTRTRVRRVPDANVRRVRPLYVYVIYYCFICVYLASSWLEATDGYLAASVLRDGLVNDHLAVAAGQVPRLATAGFVCDSPLELFMQLATLLTVGAEAEALLGHSLFWAVYWLCNLAGSLADAVASELPVTYGPANAAAGVVGALVAFYVRNWALEERIDSEREAARAERRATVAASLGPSPTASRDGTESDGSSLSSRDGDNGTGTGSSSGSRRSGGSSSSSSKMEEGEAEVELLPFWSIKLSARMSTTARGALNVLGSLVVASQGLLEFGDASRSASWLGLIAAFWTGGLLTFFAGPHYEVQVDQLPTPAQAAAAKAAAAAAAAAAASEGAGASAGVGGRNAVAGTSAGAGAEGASGSGNKAAAVAAAAVSRAVAWSAQQPPVKADADGLRVVDICPPARRPGVLFGAVGVLAAGIGAWLAYMGVDM